MGSKEDVAARIEADTRVKIEEMNQTVAVHKNPVSHLDKMQLMNCRQAFTRYHGICSLCDLGHA